MPQSKGSFTYLNSKLSKSLWKGLDHTFDVKIRETQSQKKSKYGSQKVKTRSRICFLIRSMYICISFNWANWLSQQGFSTNPVVIGVALSSVIQWLAGHLCGLRQEGSHEYLSKSNVLLVWQHRAAYLHGPQTKSKVEACTKYSVRTLLNEQRIHFALILYRYAVGLIRSSCTYRDKVYGYVLTNLWLE